MRLDPDQLEWIVREVVRRLQQNSFRSAPLSGEGGALGTNSMPDAHITLTQPLITAATLENKLDGVTIITIPKRAVITPSARDLLKEHRIQLLRI